MKRFLLKLPTALKARLQPPFDNAYKAVLVTEGGTYVQGFLVIQGSSYKPVEHSWIELSDRIVDPTLPHLNRNGQGLSYFLAHSLSVKQLKAIIEESKEDYPEDDPLPVYGEPPYEYYGNVMLGGQNYLDAYQAAVAKCQEWTMGNN